MTILLAEHIKNKTGDDLWPPGICMRDSLHEPDGIRCPATFVVRKSVQSRIVFADFRVARAGLSLRRKPRGFTRASLQPRPNSPVLQLSVNGRCQNRNATETPAGAGTRSATCLSSCLSPAPSAGRPTEL